MARAPLEHRALADRLRADGRHVEGRARSTIAGRSISTPITRCCPGERRSSRSGHISNALGTINPVRAITEAAHAHGAVVLIDGAQAVPHLVVDVTALDCDFYVFSSHKMFGPTGTGMLYGRPCAARGDATLPRRRRHDRVGDVREDDVQRGAVQVRGRDAQHCWRRRPGRRRRLSRRHRSRWGARARG